MDILTIPFNNAAKRLHRPVHSFTRPPMYKGWVTWFNKKWNRIYPVFNGMPIDVYFDECHGPLPYRSIKFETMHGNAVGVCTNG